MDFEKFIKNNYTFIKYISDKKERDNFYNFIEKYTKKPYKYFPMVFKNGVFIGGYKEWLDNKQSLE